MNTDALNQVTYRLPDTSETVPAFTLSQTGEATLLFVPSFNGERPDSLVIAHDDDLDAVFEDMESNWFNVESHDMVKIAQNLLTISKTPK